jgi:hypothetical protein
MLLLNLNINIYIHINFLVFLLSSLTGGNGWGSQCSLQVVSPNGDGNVFMFMLNEYYVSLRYNNN